MAYSYPVKSINNAMRGAPVLSGTVGSLIAALDAFLITGWAPTSAMTVTISNGVGTAQVNEGMFFEDNAVVQFDGATTPALLNGEARVLSHTNNSFKFETDAPDGTATGTITVRYAPVGKWEKAFAGTNKAAYRSTDVKASGFYLRIDDTGTLSARVRGFETMTDVDNGTGPFPTDAQISGGGHWVKSSLANATAVRYDFFGDSRAFYAAIAPGVASAAANIVSPARGFGDMVPLRAAGDSFAVALSCNATSSSGTGTFGYGSFEFVTNAADAIYLPRAISGLGSSVSVGAFPYVGASTGKSGGDGALGAFPSVVDGELKYSKRYIHSGDNATPRADVPGILYIPQSGLTNLVAPRDTFKGTGTLAGRILFALGLNGTAANSAPNGIYLIDANGPWRPQ